MSDSKFELPFDYAELDYLGMRNHVENLLGQFMNNEEEDPNNAEIEEEPSSSDL
ncbi:MAG: hypothetical protein ACI9HG_002161 [Flavobacteriales bacterium]